MTKADKEGQRKAPILRFKGFTHAWEQRQLGEVSQLNGRIGFRGYTAKDIISKESGGILTFSPTNIINNLLEVKGSNTYITREKYEESPEIQVNNSDILFVKTGSTLGKSALVSGLMEPATINPQIVIIRSQRKWIQFLSVLLMTSCIQKQITAAKIGGAVPTLTESEIKKFKFYIPNDLNETGKIGQFFSKIDSLIALYERKLQLNLKLYAELLKQFIPDKNSKSILNKINWQSISLGKIAHLQKGKQKNRNDISEVKNDKETYPVYNGGKEKSGYTDEYNRNDSIIISEGGNSAGYVNYIAGKFYSGGHNYSIEPQNIDSSLLYLILLRNQSRIMNLRTGSGLPNIKISSLKSFKIFIPSKNDNLYDFDKILILFTKDNNLIKDKLNKLKLIKKALLNTMFI